MEWRCTGLRWPEDDGGPVLGWRRGADSRSSALAYGSGLGFRATGPRTCVGARGNPCPLAAPVPGRGTGARCPECGRLDRAHSVAADTIPDDPRTYRVYLAWFGPGTVKAGITAEQRGAARLREQGAVVFTWLGRGPLMAARRAEETLRAALGVPDRVPYARKRVLRVRLPDAPARTAELARYYDRAAALEGAGWPEALERLPFGPVDHTGIFRTGDGTGPVRAVTALKDGGAVAGRLVAAAGPDLHLATAADGVVIVDTRLMTGWTLTAADADAGVGVPTVAVGGGAAQDGLF
ncbi:DUF2797 domain-containing protein [Streptomyces sp. NPDC001478]